MSLLGNIWVKLGLKSDDFQRGMDNAEKKTSRFGNIMKGAAAKVLTVAAAFRVLAGTFRTLTNFEAATSKLASVLGKTKDEISGLTQSAIDLGRKTQYTASEVVGLQTELAKLGFTENQIQSMQESVLKFAAAVGTDLPSAAARAGATMRGFNLTAEETGDLLEVMAVSTSKSALSFNYLDSTLGKLVPVAKAFGFDARDTITLLGTLANAGIDASSAGTALRRVFAELANADSKLNRQLGKQPKTMQDLIEGLQKLKREGMGVKESFDLVGKYAGAAFAALVNGADDCANLYTELQDTNGALNTMYATMTNNVTGAVKELSSAWEGFILGLESSTGPIARIIRGLTKLVNVANSALFRNTRVNEHQAYYDLMWNGKGGFNDNSTWAVQTRFAKERAALMKERENIPDKFTGAVDRWQEKMDALNASEEAWFKKVSEDAETLGGVVGDILGSGDGGDGGLEELLKKLKGAKDDAAEYAREMKEVADADAEMAAQADKMLEQYNQLHPAIQLTTEKIEQMEGLTDEQRATLLGLADDAKLTTEQILGLASSVAALVEAEQEGTLVTGKMKDALAEIRGFIDANQLTNEEAAKLVGLDDETLAKELDAVIEVQQKAADNMREIWDDAGEDIANAIRHGMIDSFDALAEAIGTGEWDTSAMVRALLNPLADAAISIGTIVMTSGEAMEALKEALHSMGENPYAAIAIGGALIAVGVAAKAGLAALAKGNSSGNSAGGNYTYTGGYGVTPAAVNSVPSELNIVVTGELKGQDIALSMERYNNNKRR